MKVRGTSVSGRGTFFAVFCAALIAFCMDRAGGQAQTQPDAAQSPAQAQTLAQITTIRNDFVSRARSSGLTCTLPPPRMEVREVSTFGDYDAATNTIASTDWTLLGPEQKTPFFRMAGPNASEEVAHATFEDTMHRSMLVHELAHWWEACHNVTRAATLSQKAG